MKVHSVRACSVMALLASLLSLMGCSQIHELVASRPSENMPAYRPVTVQFQQQNWTEDKRDWFYHSPQGTELLPYSWLLALEQPKLQLFGTVPKFADSTYLAGFGFLPDAVGPDNPDGLPVGFAKDRIVDPYSGQSLEVVGLSCAACHTGQLEYQGKGVRIDGGSAAVDLAAFQTELGYAVAFAAKVPFRFNRFARGVLGDNASEEAKNELKQQLDAFLKAGLAEKDLAQARNLYPTYGGFGRTDALGRIGNFVFGTELDDANLRVADAPANFPPLWDTSWFSWVQYNGSIQQPMVRNIGEALGVRARVNLSDPGKLYQSTVNVKSLWEMEGLLAGQTAFTGLKPPAWPVELFGPIDQAKAQRGAQLYKQHCEHCHLPPVGSTELQDAKYWEDGQAGRKFLRLNAIPLEEIGTDPKEATNWADRKAITGPLQMGQITAAEGLRLVTGKIREMNYDKLGLSPEQRMDWSGYRDDGVVGPLKYRARPLDGVWATPPYLHNGSVASLYQLLLPAERRDRVFYVGNREYDPKTVGYSEAMIKGAFEYRTDQPGNSNAGHEFRNPRGKGRIGPELSDEDRWAIIEYLKTL